MSFAGHVADMVSRIKQDKELLSSRRERMAKIRQQYYSAHYLNIKLKGRETSPEELEKVKREIRTKMQKERKREVCLSIFAFVFAFCALLCLLYLVGV